MEWKHLFHDHVLNQGKDYFKSGLVKNFQIQGDIISGEVINLMTSKSYQVIIEKVENKIKKMTCSCPYAEDSDYCKHMAALLYQYDFNINNYNSNID